ncbi:MAG: BMP family ABC transporter substrate-binding protein [Oscillospiraceae bacterium]|nr:BMP family ABC transporter substrate-binding protein [Oscillospiraceae bacterium]
MAETTYQLARKLGLKEVKARTARHEDPYLPALEQLVPHLNGLPETDLGTVRIDIEQVVGTRTAARREAFSASFYPLLEDGSEFSAKWSALAASHVKEGIREPITAIEYLNRFYVVEGHKRLSVLRYFGAGTVRAQVRRILPARSEDPEIVAYYEFLDFYKVTRANYVQLRKPGCYAQLLSLLCGEDRTPWDEDRQRSFFSGVLRFRKAFAASGLSRSLTQDEALLRYLQVFGSAHLQQRTPTELKNDLAVIGPELRSMENASSPVLMTTDAAGQPRGIISRLVHPPLRSLKAAFLHDKDPASSFWTYDHEKGRAAAQQALGDRVETVSVFNMLEKSFEDTVRALAEDGYDMVFTTTPRLLAPTLTAAGAYPGIKFLNCSLNVSHPILRCYYGRMYEAKFLTGVIAGAMSENGHIGYVCDYPVYSMPASVNAFALGARMVNPRAKIYLQWSTIPGTDIDEGFSRCEVTAISGYDSIPPECRTREKGLFLVNGSQWDNVAFSYWNWGSFYTRIIQSVLDGSWAQLNSTSEAGQTINYWWGLASGAVDVSLCPELAPQTVRLVEHLRQDIIGGWFRPFDGPVCDQSGTLRIAENEVLTPEQILHMDWLVDSVVGSIPRIGQLTPEAKELVRIQGVIEEKTE